MRHSEFGCAIHGVFLGVMMYADDIFLSASRTGLQIMVTLCYEYASKKNLKFGTNTDPHKSRTKCNFYEEREVFRTNLPVKLNGNALPWVNP